VPRARAVESIQVDAGTAAEYLRGQPIACSGLAVGDGDRWRVVRLGGRPLGWIKVAGGVGKNHLPAAARISGELTA
jgi:NOL1/NOP2/fmu family ribosome biogenesis protein